MKIHGAHNLFVLFFAGYALFLLLALPGYGPTWDVPLEFSRATAYLDNALGNPTPSGISPWHQMGYEHARSSICGSLNGCLPSLIAAVSGKILFEKSGLMGYIDAYHCGLVFLWLIFLIYFYLMLSTLHDRRTALIATILLALAPRVLGHVPNNMKDIPALAFASLSLLEFALAVTRNRPRRIYLAGILFACAISSKFTAAIVVAPAIVMLYLAFRKTDIPKSFLLPILSVPVLTLAVLIIHWPYLWVLPATLWERLVDLAAAATCRKGSGVPSIYPVLMTLITTPPVMLFGLVCLPVAALRPPRFKREEALLLGFYASWLFFVLFVFSTGRIALFDGVRHFLLYMPPAAILSAWGMVRMFDMAKGKVRFFRNMPARWREAVAGSVLLGASILPVALYHPYEVTYFNFLAGGLPGATQIQFGPEVLDYEPRDYWATSLRSAMNWVNQHLPDDSELWISIPRHLGALFELRPGLSLVRPDERQPGKPYYLIFVNRKDFFTPLEYYAMSKGELVHKVEIKGVTLSSVYKMPDLL